MEERIQFLRTGQAEICPRSLEAARCEEDFRQMVQALEDARREAREACGRLGSPALSATGASALAAQRAQMEKLRGSLDRIRGHFGDTREKMQAIRQHALRTVMRNLDSSPANQPMEAEAKAAVFLAAYPSTDVEELRSRVLALNVPARHRDVNTLWVAVNALELEQYSGRQVERLEAGLGAASRTSQEAGGRQAGLNSVNGSGASNPLGGLLSSPALPGLLGAAAQLAAASKAGNNDSGSLPPQADLAPGPGAGAPSPPPSLPPSRLHDSAQREDRAEEAGEAKIEDEKKADNLNDGLPVTYSAGGSGISSDPPGHAGAPWRSFAAANAKPPEGGGSTGANESQGATEGEASAEKDSGTRSLASEAGFPGGGSSYGGGGGGGSGLFSDSGSGNPSSPAADALAAILGEQLEGSPQTEEDQAGTEAPPGDKEPSLFVLVHEAYMRGLREGRLDNSRPLLKPPK